MASAIYEINIGNGVSPQHFILCASELEQSGIKGLSLAAHLRINPDLGMADFDWTDNAFTVLESGTDLTFKYESDGTARELDTMGAYFVSDDEREDLAEQIGDVIYYKSLRASKDGRDMMRQGYPNTFRESLVLSGDEGQGITGEAHSATAMEATIRGECTGLRRLSDRQDPRVSRRPGDHLARRRPAVA